MNFSPSTMIQMKILRYSC